MKKIIASVSDLIIYSLAILFYGIIACLCFLYDLGCVLYKENLDFIHSFLNGEYICQDTKNTEVS